MVEAKALGKSLDAAKDKGFQYCWKNKVSYYVVTDGNTWEVHDLREVGGRTVLRISVGDGSPGEVARFLLALWRPAMPAVEIPPPSLTNPQPPPAAITPVPPTTLSLEEIEQRMQKGEIPRKAPPPKKLILPDGSEKPTRSWRDLLLAVAEWSQPWIGAKLPLTWPSTGRLLVAREPSGMRAPKAVGPYWVETHTNALYIVKHARLILDQTGKDSSRVQVVLH